VALLATIGSGKPTIDADTGRISIPVRNSVPDLMASAVLLSGAGIVPRDMGVRRPSLDDVFLALTGHPGSKPEAVEPPPAPTKDASLAKGATP
jgi:ABC-2 type transport system ATP-binding protein